jgi:hypothetical protein
MGAAGEGLSLPRRISAQRRRVENAGDECAQGTISIERHIMGEEAA